MMTNILIFLLLGIQVCNSLIIYRFHCDIINCDSYKHGIEFKDDVQEISSFVKEDKIKVDVPISKISPYKGHFELIYLGWR